MPVIAGIYGQKEPRYVGCVLYTYEHNMAWDSYWYAVCWDREKKEMVEVEYDTTAAAGGGTAIVEATEEVLREMYHTFRNEGRRYFDTVLNEKWAKNFEVGDTVVVVRGRKIPQGTVGVVFWKGKTRNQWNHQEEMRCGIEYDGHRVFLPAEYCERQNWEAHLLHGKARKQAIQNFAYNSIPIDHRHHFPHQYYRNHLRPEYYQAASVRQ